MIWVETLREAFRSLLHNKTRTFLSMLGIIIGTIAVITAMALGQGAVRGVTERISSLGSNVIMIWPGQTGGKGGKRAQELSDILQLSDVENIRGMCPDVKSVTPLLNGGTLIQHAGTNTVSNVYAAEPAFFSILDVKIESGREISETDERNYQNVAVVGSDVAGELFGKDDPIGKRITLLFKKSKTAFTVVGVLERTGEKLAYNPDKMVIVPYSVGEVRMFQLNGQVSSIIASAKSPQVAKNAVAEIEEVLNLRLGDPNKYKIISQDTILSTVNESAGLLTLLLTALASVSLLVGGIGIMNIMLVSVTERTREIGVKMAIGATKMRILMEFLVESMVVTLVAGALGVIGSYLITILITHLARQYSLVLIITAPQILIACGTATLIGLFFGIYPAKRASKLNPVEAVRYE